MKDAKIPIGWLVPIAGFIMLLGWFLGQQGWSISKINPPGIELVPPTATNSSQTVQPSQPVVIPQSTPHPAPAPSQFVEVTRITEVTRIVEVTREILMVVTATPLPPTATSSNPLTLPFDDSFSTSLRPEWRILSGQPVVVNGKLTASTDEVVLEIGDSTLSNYVVEFDYEMGVSLGGTYGGITPYVGKNFRYLIQYQYCSWQLFQNNSWVDVVGVACVPPSGHLKLTITGSNYDILINGRPSSNTTYGTPIQGPFGLSIARGQNIDTQISPENRPSDCAKTHSRCREFRAKISTLTMAHLAP